MANQHFAKEVPGTYWKTSTDLPSFPALQEDTECDVTIIGGGITGITTAYELTKRGFRVVLIEANQVLNGTTAHTTAKVTAQHDMIYDEFIRHFGLNHARLYYEANQNAIDYIKGIVNGSSKTHIFIRQMKTLFKKSAPTMRHTQSSELKETLSRIFQFP